LAFKEGRTGYPFIDAIMAQLRTEGILNYSLCLALLCFALLCFALLCFATIKRLNVAFYTCILVLNVRETTYNIICRLDSSLGEALCGVFLHSWGSVAVLGEGGGDFRLLSS
jgi:FAD binding domain of DNA photolyase